MIDAELKAKWVEGLRSGEFEQERGMIGHGKRLCCIGVGGAAAGMTVDGPRWYSHDVGKKIGLTGREITTLIDMNDKHLISFTEIAQYIEANL